MAQPERLGNHLPRLNSEASGWQPISNEAAIARRTSPQELAPPAYYLKTVAHTSILLNVPSEKGRSELVSEVLMRQGWTEEQLDAARDLIATDPDLAREVSYAGALTPGVFEMARRRLNPAKATRWCTGCGETSIVNRDGICYDCAKP